jgi:hypothetical protein
MCGMIHSARDLALHQFLGMTWAEYSLWTIQPNLLAEIVNERKRSLIKLSYWNGGLKHIKDELMNVVYRLQGNEFEWDTNKSLSNIDKHGVTFEEAAEVFLDPFYQSGDATVNEEIRDFIIGYSLM